MKQVKFETTWRNQVNATTVHEYPAGYSGTVADETAVRATAAGVLDGSPRDVKPAARSAGRSKPKAKAARVPAVEAPAPAAPLEPAEPASTDA